MVVFVVLAGAGCEGSQAGEDAAASGCISECTRFQVCSMRICLPSFFPGTFTVTVESGTFPSTRANGTPWDVDGPPDPYATVVHDTTTLGTGGVIADSVAPVWNAPLPTAAALTRQDSIRVDVYDDDGATAELMFSCTKRVVEVLHVSENAFHYGCILEPSQASGRVAFSLTPQ